MRKLYYVLIIFFFTACSRNELATIWADSYITNQIDRYFDINSLQSQFIKKSLKDDIEKIRIKIFPRIAQEMQKILNEVKGKTVFTEQIINDHEEVFKNIFYDGLKIFENSAVEFSAKLTHEQLESFENEFQSKTEILRKEARDRLEAREKRFTKIREQLENWIGLLTDKQRKDLKEFCDENLFPMEEQILNREKLSREFVKSFPDKNKRKKFVSKLFLSYELLRDPTYTKAVLNDQKKLYAFIAKVLNETTEGQKRRLGEVLQDRIDKLNGAPEAKKFGFL